MRTAVSLAWEWGPANMVAAGALLLLALALVWWIGGQCAQTTLHRMASEAVRELIRGEQEATELEARVASVERQLAALLARLRQFCEE